MQLYWLFNMFEGVSNFIRVTCDAGHAPFVDFYLSIFEKLSTCTCVPNLNSVAVLFFTAQCTFVHKRGLGIACRPSSPSVRL